MEKRFFEAFPNLRLDGVQKSPVVTFVVQVVAAAEVGGGWRYHCFFEMFSVGAMVMFPVGDIF